MSLLTIPNATFFVTKKQKKKKKEKKKKYDSSLHLFQREI